MEDGRGGNDGDFDAGQSSWDGNVQQQSPDAQELQTS